MRVTNMMIQNNMMLNINKNAGQTDKLFQQIATGKKINLPSDDPIIASRSMRFRAMISSTEQYQRNNEQAMSWTSTTATAYENTVARMDDITEVLTRGANDTMSLSERKDIATSLRAYLDEIKAQMNTSYAGRYVFSGYRTDEPAVLLKSDNSAYSINQTLEYDDAMAVKSYWKEDADTMATMNDVTMIRLPYSFAKNITLSDETGAVITDGTGTAVTVQHRSIEDATDPYANIGDDDVVYIDETGELLLGKNMQEKLLEGNMNINYDKEKFLKGELNPVVYFDCVERTGPITETNPASGSAVIDPASGILVSADSQTNLVQKVDQNGNPVVDAGGNPVYISYTMEDQDLMSYELSYKTRIKINSLAKDAFTDNMYSDLDRAISRVLDMEISTEASLRLKYKGEGLTGDALEEAIQEQLSKETTQVQAIIQDEFAGVLDKLKDHRANMSRQHTDLGARQARLDTIQIRLEEDLLNFQTLNSENEDVDYEEAIANLNMTQSVYDASLKISAKITQLSLLNYL